MGLPLGASFFAGEAENSDQGKGGNPAGDPTVSLFAFDAEYSIGKFDFRGEFAHIHITDADEIGNNVASDIQGYYVEGAYHLMPDKWKRGKLKDSDFVGFVRYENLDTQQDMPSDVVANDAGDKEEITAGFSFFLTPQFVIKADYQWKEDDRSGDQGRNQMNFGIGWDF